MNGYLKVLIFIAAIALNALIVKLILRKVKFRSNKFNGTLKYPLAYRISPLLFIAFFVITTITVMIVDPRDWHFIFLSGAIALVCIPLMIVMSIWRVEVGSDEFVYISYFGKKRTYKYSELTIRHNEKRTKCRYLKGGEVVFCMPYFITDGDKLERAYKKYHREI